MSRRGRTTRSGPSGRSGDRRRGLGSIALALSVLTAACGDPGRDGTTDPGLGSGGAPATAPAPPAAAGDRAVIVRTGVCGAADPGLGSGLALAPDRVLTAAHVVASGGAIEIEWREATGPARLVAYDPLRDLALLEPERPLDGVADRPPFGSADEADRLLVIGAATSGLVEAVVADVTRIEMDEVRGSRRSIRDGYLLDAATVPGDSGAGLYDEEGRLIGLLFAVSTDDGRRSWATAAAEIAAFLDESTVPASYRCDPDRSAVTEVG